MGAPCEAYPVPEAVIFDLDGVLLDSEQLWNRAKEQSTRCSGGRRHEDAPTVMLGMSSPEWARYLHDELAVPLDPQEINRQVVRRMQELYREQLPLLPGALDVVHALRQRWPLGLSSFSNREIIELLLELGWASSPARSLPPSPQKRWPGASRRPTCILAAAEKMGVDPAKSAAVEDSSNGLRAATAAGMTVIAVPNPHYPPTDDALKLAAATVDVTPKLVERSRADASPARDGSSRSLALRHQGREPALWLASPHCFVAVAGTTAPCPAFRREEHSRTGRC